MTSRYQVVAEANHFNTLSWHLFSTKSSEKVWLFAWER